MIVLKTSSFVLFIFLIIISTITIYTLLHPYTCRCKENRKINIYRGKIKYVPVIIKKDLEKILESQKKKDNNCTKLKDNNCTKLKDNKCTKLKKKSDTNSSSIGGHSSTHGGSIVPSKWIDDDDDESSFKFKY